MRESIILTQSGRCSSSNPKSAIAAGAFHNDVVAVANERVLFTHEQAFEEPRGGFYAATCGTPKCRKLEIVVVPASRV